jgi:hypothetical protein
MGKYKHHSGAISGGVNLSKGKTPHDSLMKYMPIDDKASVLFKMKQPFEMGKMHRGPLDKKGKHSDSGIYKMDPMHNGIPGVQKEDFEQFKSPNKMGHKKDGPEMRGPLNKKCPDGMAWDEARNGCFKSKKEEAKMKTNVERRIETKKPKQ